jgi:mono/diheme cytochrome c family protein
VKRCVSWAGVALGVALVGLGTVRAADVSQYTFKALFSLGQPFGNTGETLGQVIKVGTMNKDGTVVGVSNYGNGEGAFLVTADGKTQVLSRPGQASPAGGTFGGGIDNKIGINDSGNIAFGVDVDRGSGAREEVLFFDKAANKWSSIAQKGIPAPGGGTIDATVGFASLNNQNDIVFTGQLGGSTAVFLSDGATRALALIAGPGTKIGDTAIKNARSGQISPNGRIVTFEAEVEAAAGFGAYGFKDGQLTALAPPGTHAPPGGDILDELRGPVPNSSGNVAMLGHTGKGWGAYLLDLKAGTFNRVAGPGDTLSGAKVTNLANAYRNDVRLGEDGAVLFSAQLDDGGGGIFLGENGKISEIARTGKTLAGVGKVKATASNGVNAHALASATNGNIAFTAQTDDDKISLVLGSLPAAKASTVSFSKDVLRIFNSNGAKTCSNCHRGSSPPAGMNLQAANAYTNIVGVASTESPSLKRVLPGGPDNSYLFQKVNTGKMPKAGGKLVDADIAAIQTWIKEGAQNN